MGATFVITLREGFEIALIIAILLAYLRRLDRRDRFAQVWSGALSAVAVSAIAGTIVFISAGDLSQTAKDTFEGVVSLVAVGFLTWMLFWMRKHARHMAGDLHGKVDIALSSGAALALPLIAFFMVAREGLETALLLFTGVRATAATNPALGLLGAALGLVPAAAMGFVVYRGSHRINLRAFFQVTGVLILLVGAGLLAHGLHELQDVGLAPVLTSRAFELHGVMGNSGLVGGVLRALFGYNAAPSWLEVTAWLAFVAAVGFAYFRPTRIPPAPPLEEVTAEAEAPAEQRHA